ncbi:MAG: nucleotide exchange factor GrpE [Gammaproteobacteria bacterium]
MGKSKNNKPIADSANLDSGVDSNTQSAVKDEPQELFAETIKLLEDKCLRLSAEIENMHKRHAVEIEKAHKFGLEHFVRELLVVIDNLEQALKSFVSSNTSDREGIELTLKSFENILDKFGIRPINPKEERFNPLMHEAVSVITNQDLSDDDVMEVFQRGWAINERVIRPARVVVVKN